MFLRHNKVSGQANTDPGKVGGADWDGAHALAAGSMFPVAHLVLDYNQGSDWCYTTTSVGGVVAGFSNPSAGEFLCTVRDDYPLMPSTALVLDPVMLSLTGLPAGWTYTVSSVGGGDIAIYTYDATYTQLDPTANFRADLIVFGEIVVSG